MPGRICVLRPGMSAEPYFVLYDIMTAEQSVG